MSSHYSHYYDSSVPLDVPSGGKVKYSDYYMGGRESSYSVSPPEGDVSSSSGESALLSSYGHSGSGYSVSGGGNSSYAGSSMGDYDSIGSANGIDLNEYMQDRFADSFNPLPLDKCMAIQAQTSGRLNDKQRQVLEMQAKVQARLAKSRARFAEGLQDARQVRADLEWTQKKVSSLKTKASKKHSKEYNKARARYPSPEY